MRIDIIVEKEIQYFLEQNERETCSVFGENSFDAFCITFVVKDGG
jgi:hypothetical protein